MEPSATFDVARVARARRELRGDLARARLLACAGLLVTITQSSCQHPVADSETIAAGGTFPSSERTRAELGIVGWEVTGERGRAILPDGRTLAIADDEVGKRFVADLERPFELPPGHLAAGVKCRGNEGSQCAYWTFACTALTISCHWEGIDCCLNAYTWCGSWAICRNEPETQPIPNP